MTATIASGTVDARMAGCGNHRTLLVRAVADDHLVAALEAESCDGDAPRTVLEELAKIKSGDVVLPIQTKQGHHHGTVRLRCVTEPDEAQKVLLNRFGITCPAASAASTRLHKCSGNFALEMNVSPYFMEILAP